MVKIRRAAAAPVFTRRSLEVRSVGEGALVASDDAIDKLGFIESEEVAS